MNVKTLRLLNETDSESVNDNLRSALIAAFISMIVPVSEIRTVGRETDDGDDNGDDNLTIHDCERANGTVDHDEAADAEAEVDAIDESEAVNDLGCWDRKKSGCGGGMLGDDGDLTLLCVRI